MFIYLHAKIHWHQTKLHVCNVCYLCLVQRLELQKNNADDNENVRGQIVISLISRDRGGSGPSVADAAGILSIRDPNELPEG